MPIFILLLITLLTANFATAAETPQGQAPAIKSETVTRIMQESIVPNRFELPSQAPQIWRKYKQQKPALILFSEHPFLQQIPPQLQTRINNLMEEGTADDFYRHASIQRCDPLLLPMQTLNAALSQQYFSEIIWYFPFRQKLTDISIDDFRTQMTTAGFLNTAEADKLKIIEEGVIEGDVQGVPLRIIHPLAFLPEIDRPALLHIDLGYFRGLYINEISTPAYDLLQETVELLRDSQWNTLGVTLSTSTEGGNYSLATRFLIADLARLLTNPALLDDKMPVSWKNRKEAMFNQNFFQESKARKLIQLNATKFPNDPTVQFDTYQLLVQAGDNQAAFVQLDKAVALDPGYAEEYLALAESGKKEGWHDQTLIFLDKAAKAYPQNPFILLQKADLLISLKRNTEAKQIYTQLQNKSWSKFFYPTIPEELKQRNSDNKTK